MSKFATHCRSCVQTQGGRVGARLLTEKGTGRSRGIAFVEFDNEADADRCPLRSHVNGFMLPFLARACFVEYSLLDFSCLEETLRNIYLGLAVDVY